MDKYQLAKLVQWAGTLRSRKRMQKVVFLLQSSGCPFDAEFYLHRFGPYSSELAQLTDLLVNQNLLKEENFGNGVGREYAYVLPEASVVSLTSFEATSAGSEKLKSISQFEDRGTFLLQRGLKELEYASTIAYYRQKGANWEDAFLNACKFKGLEPSGKEAKEALALAKKVSEPE